ncbi:hypothetical protein HQ487_04075 [Candidatus Uhrbacteria bacterium]|nr:hypothetical protein [Candidatus Uhrbacteria bacterium]
MSENYRPRSEEIDKSERKEVRERVKGRFASRLALLTVIGASTALLLDRMSSGEDEPRAENPSFDFGDTDLDTGKLKREIRLRRTEQVSEESEFNRDYFVEVTKSLGGELDKYKQVLLEIQDYTEATDQEAGSTREEDAAAIELCEELVANTQFELEDDMLVITTRSEWDGKDVFYDAALLPSSFEEYEAHEIERLESAGLADEFGTFDWFYEKNDPDDAFVALFDSNANNPKFYGAQRIKEFSETSFKEKTSSAEYLASEIVLEMYVVCSSTVTAGYK